MKTAHLSDDRLVELYFTDTPSAREQQHLGGCHDCDSRRCEIAHLLDETSQASAEEVDAVFPAERLAKQQLQIMERAEAAAGPARVIAFPAAQSPEPGVIARTRSTTTRWVAAAAVAGLVVGVVAGRAGRDFRPAFGPGLTPAVQVRQDGGPSIQGVSTTLSDDEFLVELESAIDGQGGGALRALDELTPRTWDR
jgi:hypothetical protein